jgi:hypothetical protein
MGGTAADKFAPDAKLSRAMLWTILARNAGVDTTATAGETWWSAAREWAIANEVSDGTNADRNVTRNELAAMLYRLKNPGKDGYDGDALVWAQAAKILEDGRPTDNATRAEAANMLQVFTEGAK